MVWSHLLPKKSLLVVVVVMSGWVADQIWCITQVQVFGPWTLDLLDLTWYQAWT